MAMTLDVNGKPLAVKAAHDTPLMKNSRHCFSDWGSELAPGPAAPGRLDKAEEFRQKIGVKHTFPAADRNPLNKREGFRNPVQ